MNAVDKLLALEEIRSLMARRVRCLDEKDWEGFAACYADDAVSYSFVRPEAPEDKIVGAKEIAARVAKALDGVTTAHQIHTPELEVLSEDRATGVWPLNDVLSRMREGKRHWMRGYGHDRQAYRKVGGRWVIQEHRLTRLLLETGVED
jgi:ketosteroid isomerase-like protein